jgi:hypothetical protein
MSARSLAALALTTAAAFAAAGPAGAVDNRPVDANGNKSCDVYSKSGDVIWVPHGTVVTDKNGDKYKCLNGSWTKVDATKLAPGTYGVRSPLLGLVTLQVQLAS